MDAPVAGPAKPLAYVESIANANQTTGGTAGVWQSINYGSDVESRLLSLIDRPTTSRFRALIAGYYEISYTTNMSFAANQRGGRCRIFKNGTTALTNSIADAFGNSGGENKAGSATCRVITLLAANDYLEVQVNPSDGSIVTIYASSKVSFRLLEPA